MVGSAGKIKERGVSVPACGRRQGIAALNYRLTCFLVTHFINTGSISPIIKPAIAPTSAPSKNQEELSNSRLTKDSPCTAQPVVCPRFQISQARPAMKAQTTETATAFPSHVLRDRFDKNSLLRTYEQTQ